ncbi:MAG: aspartate kinase [Clostridia bacterium]|nr:aspartate kinase [Clostridia bacterium]
MIVTKFGGSSLADSAQFEKVKNIIQSDARRTVVVVSAPGKKKSGDNKITDLLYTLGGHLKYGVPDETLFAAIKDRLVEIKTALSLDYDVGAELDELASTFGKNTDQSFLVSRGEYFSAKLMASFLGYTFVDAAEVIKFDFDGTINEKESARLIKSAYDKYGKIVVPGFYGAYPNGDVNLFSRGGSDITGAYLARFLEAEIYENWTDVSGIFTADPRIVALPKSIARITYEELRELSYMGANVLHEDSVLPVQEAGIDINILNTEKPGDRGTIITREAGSGPFVTGIAGKKGFVSFNIHKKHMSGEIGFLRKVLSVFEKYSVSIEHTPSGMDVISVIVEEAKLKNTTYPIISEIETALGASVTLERGLSLIAVVGRNMAGKVGICSSMFGILGKSGVNIRLLAQAPDELTIIVGVAEVDHEKAILCLYEGLRGENLL